MELMGCAGHALDEGNEVKGILLSSDSNDMDKSVMVLGLGVLSLN